MIRYLVILAIACALAVFVPRAVQEYLQRQERQTLAASESSGATSRNIVLSADRQGRFKLSLRINGYSIVGVLDTGATMVALPQSVAKRAGIHVSPNDFTKVAVTANGEVDFAPVTLDRLDIEGLRLRDVHAAVIPDEALSEVLLGMTAMSRLGSVQFEPDRLVIRHPK